MASKQKYPPLTDAEEAELQRQIAADPDDAEAADEQLAQAKPFAEAFPELSASIKRAEDRLEAAVEAGAHAFHDAARDKGSLRWETASEKWRQDMRDLVRPVVVAALKAVDGDSGV